MLGMIKKQQKRGVYISIYLSILFIPTTPQSIQVSGYSLSTSAESTPIVRGVLEPDRFPFRPAYGNQLVSNEGPGIY